MQILASTSGGVLLHVVCLLHLHGAGGVLNGDYLRHVDERRVFFLNGTFLTSTQDHITSLPVSRLAFEAVSAHRLVLRVDFFQFTQMFFPSVCLME